MFLNAWLKKFHKEPPLWIRPRLGKVAFPEFAKMLSVTLRYPDCIFIENGQINIVEAKYDPSAEAIGQLQLYEQLFKETPEFEPWWIAPIQLLFLTSRLDENIKVLCDRYHILYEVFKYP